MLLTKMSCVENIPPVQEPEREEGEIIDELDDLSDISSEEEYLLRQRLQVLENYNNVLERKKAKKTSVSSGKKRKDIQTDISELSDISCTAIEDDTPIVLPQKKKYKDTKTHHRGRRKKAPVQSRPIQPKPIQSKLTKLNLVKQKETKKKIRPTRKLEPAIVISESSDESDYEYRNKRRKLANAVSIKTSLNTKTDTSLKARLMNMLCITRTDEHYFPENKIEILNSNSKSHNSETLENYMASSFDITPDVNKTQNLEEVIVNTNEVTKVINEPKSQLLDTVNSSINVIEKAIDVTLVNSINQNSTNDTELNDESNDDLEILRQHALNSKTKKQEPDKIKPQIEAKSEDEDSDTAELRLICLRSALLKKAIEMKQKQKLRKRLSQSTSLYDEIVEQECMDNSENNNTDIESVDMDIGSDHDNKNENSGQIIETFICKENNKVQKPKLKSSDKEKAKLDDLDEDEDLLRAKLLTSLSKNLFVEADNLNVSIEDIQNNEKADMAAKIEETQVPVEKRFIINTADSDSEAEHEATKNLTKMHVKLSDSVEFQQRLDLFLKSTRMEVEKKKPPDVVKKPDPVPESKTPEKFVPKTVNHLPKSEQMEYKNLVKRMAELEKIKQARQASMPAIIPADIARGPVKPRTIPMQNNRQISVGNLEDQIAISRKKIAEESSKVLSLKDEGQKMIQRYKIVATELRNLSTAISLNKKEQRSAQIRLSKMRSQHQGLLKRTNFQSNSINLTSQPKSTSSPNPTKHVQIKPPDYKNQTTLKSVKVSVANDINEQINSVPDLSIKLDVSTNTKICKPKEIHSNVNSNDGKAQNDKGISQNNKGISQNDKGISQNDKGISQNEKDKSQDHKVSCERQVVCVKNDNDDYKSPLDAFAVDNWNEDPHGFLCPFEVGGRCKDAKCKFLHPKNPSH